MGVRLSVNFPNIAKGTELDVGGVLVENGGSVELDDDRELSFVARHKKSVKDWAGDSEYVKVSGSPKYGPKAVEELFPEPVAPVVEPAPVEPEAEEGDKS